MVNWQKFHNLSTPNYKIHTLVQISYGNITYKHHFQSWNLIFRTTESYPYKLESICKAKGWENINDCWIACPLVVTHYIFFVILIARELVELHYGGWRYYFTISIQNYLQLLQLTLSILFVSIGQFFYLVTYFCLSFIVSYLWYICYCFDYFRVCF